MRLQIKDYLSLKRLGKNLIDVYWIIIINKIRHYFIIKFSYLHL